MKIAVVGSGNGAVTAAVDMVDQGHDVKLYCRNSSIKKFQNAMDKGGFDYNDEREEKFIPFTDISDDISYVLKDAEIIQVVIPSSYIEYYAKIMAEHVTNDQLIFFNIAAAMASIRFMNVLEDRHIEVQPKFAEANTLTYGTRVDFEEVA